MALYWQPEVETLPRKDLEALQLARLRSQVERLYRESPFFQEKWAGLKKVEVRHLEDLAQFPVVTKAELREEQRLHPPLGRYVLAPPERWGEYHPSSGTTGFPVGTVWSQGDVERIAQVTARTLFAFGLRPGDILLNGFSYGLWVAGLAVHHAARALGLFVLPVGAGQTERHLELMARFRPKALTATPSFGLYLAEALRERGMESPLRIGAFGGEAGTENPATRRRLEEALGLKAYDYYGLAEMGPTFAGECEAQAGLHFAEDHYLVEVVDPETKEPLPEGELGVLVLTHLTREATPLVRYYTGDLARITKEPCPCGRTHLRALGGILGRADDLVVYRGAKFYPSQVEEVVRRFPELSSEYRIEVEEAGGVVRQVTVVAELARPGVGEGVLEGLRRSLKEALGVTPALRLEAPGTLERTAFKAKRVVRHVRA
ncbi:phenylacetate--CoA ligase [Thermus oshimai]|jgi:phenylacetate-CoA ligase|uniref:Coenzyme F390 synthetase n=1 Tax=Thermus oshimai JL-2 TaxID=751945 RepID=K7R8L6_THEOS|nr:phenylacetate--CoA ligase [Thermus oshimai]AFV77434.1 coenzyme F390 synthetase [Thermus oshimai JL-2]